MKETAILRSPLFWLASASFALAIGVGCSSSSSGTSPSTDAGGARDSGADAAPEDTGSAEDGAHLADGAHDGGAPDALYGACAVSGGFGWPCNAAATGADPTDCTDPNFPECFVGGQGAWCTKVCTTLPDCTNGANDAGCAPTGCNNRGYCK